MKRYQCIHSVSCDSDTNKLYIAFKAGKFYPSEIDGELSCLKDEIGTKHIIDDWLLTHFKELEPIDEDIAYQQPEDKYDKAARGIGIGCAIAIAFFLTILALIFFR